MKMPIKLEKMMFGFIESQVIYSSGEKHMIIGVKKNA